jgi:hypothetical protein
MAVGALALLLLALPPAAPRAYGSEPQVGLGKAETYSVLAGTAITNTLTTTLSGDLGLSPGAALTGFPPGVVNGATHVADLEASLAKSDFSMAFDDAVGRTQTDTVNGDLNGFVLPAGVYAAPSALAVTGTLTLDAKDDPSALFIFQIGSALNTGADSNINLINGAQICNVIWAVGSAATLGAASSFSGTLMANAAITVGNGTEVHGRALAGTAVTLADNDFSTPRCSATPPGTGGGTGAAAAGNGNGGSNGKGGGNGGGSGGANGNGGGSGGANGNGGGSGGGSGNGGGGNGGGSGNGGNGGSGSGGAAGNGNAGGNGDSAGSALRDLPITGADSLRTGLLGGLLIVGGLTLRRRRTRGRHRLG